MKMVKLCALVFGVVLMGTALANPRTGYHYQVRGNGADAWFESYGECGGSYASIWMQEGVSLAGGPRTSFTSGSMSFSSYDWCVGESLYGWGDLTGAQFDSNGARGASLSYTGEAYVEQFLGCEPTVCPCQDENDWGYCEYEGEWGPIGCYCDWESGICYHDECRWDYQPVAVSIDLTWSPDSGVYRGMYSSQYRFDGGFSRSRSTGTSASGPVEGTFTVGEVSYCGGDFNSYGSVWNSTYGDLWVSRPLR